MKLKVENHPNLVRDSQSNAIVNEDRVGFDKYKKEKALRQNMDRVVKEVDTLKDDIEQIKSMLQNLINNK